MVFDISKYETNKAFDLPLEKQEEILDHLNHLHKQYVSHTRGFNMLTMDICDYTAQITSAKRELKEAIQLLEMLDIKVAFDWVGHRNKYFFPTYEDALAEEDWLWQCGEG